MNYGEYTYSEIAEEHGISRERVRQIEKEALKKLAVQFRQLGYDEAFVQSKSISATCKIIDVQNLPVEVEMS